MMIDKNIKVCRYLLVLTAVLATVGSCRINDGNYDTGKPISFAPSVCNSAGQDVRGTLINSGDGFFSSTCDTFRVASYGVEALVKGVTIPAYTKVKFISGTKWSPVDASGNPVDYCWVTGTTQRFFAYTNLPSVAGAASVSNTDDSKQRLTYDASKVTDAANQKDILMACCERTATTTTEASISFSHPLTALKFTYTTEDLSYYSLDKITISGLAKSGYVDMSVGSEPYSDWTIGSYDLSIDRTSSLTDWYILIPQNLTSHPVTVTAYLSKSGTNITATTKIKTGEWGEGLKNVYSIKYSDYKDMNELSVDLIAWGTVWNADDGLPYFPVDFNK